MPITFQFFLFFLCGLGFYASVDKLVGVVPGAKFQSREVCREVAGTGVFGAQTFPSRP